MFKEFWNKKRYLFEFVGAATAIGALFLSVQSPAGSVSYTALQYVKLTWLIIIFLGLIILLFQLFIFVIRVENIALKKRIVIENELSSLVILFFAFLIYAIGRYTWLSYNSQILRLFSSPVVYLSLILFFTQITANLSLRINYSKFNTARIITLMIVTSIVSSFIEGGIFALSHKKIPLVKEIITTMITFFAMNLVINFLVVKKVRSPRLLQLISMITLLLFTVIIKCFSSSIGWVS